MERERSLEAERRIVLDNEVVNNESKSIDLSQLVWQTKMGLRTSDWEAYSMVVVGDAERFTTFYKKFTSDGKVSVIKDKEGILNRSEYDFEYAKSINEMNLQITPPNSFNRIYTPAVSYVTKDENGEENEYGIQNLAGEFRKRFEKLGEEIEAQEDDEVLQLQSQEVDDRNIHSVISARPREIKPKEEISENQLELGLGEEKEPQGAAVIIAATATALRVEFEAEREKDRQEFERRLAEQKKESDRAIEELGGQIIALETILNEQSEAIKNLKNEEQSGQERPELTDENQSLRDAQVTTEELAQAPAAEVLEEEAEPEIESNKARVDAEPEAEGALVYRGESNSAFEEHQEIEVVRTPVAIATVGSSPLAEADYSWMEDPYRVNVLISETNPIEIKEETKNCNGSSKVKEAELINGAGRGEDGKFISVKKSEPKVKKEESRKKVEQELSEKIYSYNLSNGWVIYAPNKMNSISEVKKAAEAIINAYDPRVRNLGWIEDEFRKEVKKMKKSYSKSKLNQIKIVPPVKTEK